MNKILFLLLLVSNAVSAQIYIPPGKAIYINNSSLYVNGYVSDSGTVAGNGYLILNGNAPQNVSGNGTISKMVMANSSGVHLTNSNLSITDSLILQQGTISLGANSFTVGRTNAGSPASYVRTNGNGVLKQSVASGAVIFPVGNSSFNPLTLTNNGTTDLFSVRVTDDVLTNGTTGNTVNSPVVRRTWHISEAVAGGSNASITPQWNSGETINGFDQNHVYLAHHNGTAWEHYGINPATAPAASGSNPYTITKTGVTAFSPFAVASAGTPPLGGSPCTIAPKKPGNFEQTGGATKVCPTETRTYSVNAVTGADSYNWVMPNGAVIQSGQGTTSIVVLFTNQFPASAVLSVTAVNNCGVSPPATKTVNKNTAPAVSAITGKNYGVCDLVGEAYSVNPIDGASYNWILTSAQSTLVSGQGTNAVTVDFAHAFGTGKVQVKATNGCGTSSLKSLTVKSAPNKPAAITGPAAVCAGQQNVPYSIDPVYSAETYTWIAPSGSQISDGINTSTGTTFVTPSTSVTVDFGTNTGTLKVRGNNDCASGGYKTMQISFNCRTADVAGYCNLFPNPTHDRLNIAFYSAEKQNALIKIYDALGKEVLKLALTTTEGNNEQTLDVSRLAAGVYQMLIEGSRLRYQERFIVE